MTVDKTGDKNHDAFFLKAYYTVLQDKRLSSTDKLVLSQIHSLDKSEKHCWATNKSLADLLGMTIDTVSKSIGKLEDLGLVNRNGLGKDRVLISNLVLIQSNEKPEVGKIQPNEKPEVDRILALQPNEKPEVGKGIDLMIIAEQPNEKPEVPGQPNDNRDSTYVKPISIKDNNKIKELKDKRKYEIISAGALPIFSKLQKSKQDDILLLFDFWNDCKKSNKWKSHRRITPDMIKVILDSLRTYSLEDIAEAIANYSWALQSGESYWTYSWPLSIFLSVKDDKTKDGFKKWWKWLPENFVKENYLTRGYNGDKSTRKQEETLLDDPNPGLTAKFERAHRAFTGRRWKPTLVEKNRLIQATIRAVNTVRNIDKEWVQNYILESLTAALKQYYRDNGNPVQVGCWASDFTWDTLMSQYLGSMGVNDENLFNFADEKPKDEFEVEVMPEQKKAVEESDFTIG